MIRPICRPQDLPQRRLNAADFANITGVSRETTDALAGYASLLEKWQRRINLVGPNTLPDLWRRHMLDSAQLAPLIPPGARRLLDLGSGAGFPGLVLAAMTGMEVHLVESDQRKAAFLREAARTLGVTERVFVHAKRAETLQIDPPDVISARALAPLPSLLTLALPFWNKGCCAVFPKGKQYKDELTDINYGWYIDYDVIPSAVDPDSVVLAVSHLAVKAKD